MSPQRFSNLEVGTVVDTLGCPRLEQKRVDVFVCTGVAALCWVGAFSGSGYRNDRLEMQTEKTVCGGHLSSCIFEIPLIGEEFLLFRVPPLPGGRLLSCLSAFTSPFSTCRRTSTAAGHVTSQEKDVISIELSSRP